MKRMSFLLLAAVSCAILMAQPKTVNYQKEHDFILEVFANPTFSIYEFLSVGLSEKNTQLLPEERYHKSTYVQKQCKKMYGKYTYAILHDVYRKVSASWTIFKEVQYTDLSYNGFGKYMMHYDPFDTSRPMNCPNPELKHKLSIVPLKLK